MDTTDIAYWKDHSQAQLISAVRDETIAIPTLLELCQTLRRSSRRHDAISLLQALGERTTLTRPAVLLYADLALETQAYDLALELSQAYLTRHPDDPHVLLRRGRAYHRLEEPSLALSDLQASRSRLPDAPLVLSSLSMCYAQQQQWSDAYKCLAPLLDTHPHHLGWRLRAVHYLRMLSRYSEAQSSLDIASDMAASADQSAQVRMQQLHLWMALDDHTALHATHEESLRLAISRPQIYRVIAQYYRAQREYATAITTLQAALNHAQHPEIALDIVQLYLMRSDYLSAQAALTTYKDLYGASVRYHLLAAQLMRSTSRLITAATHYDHVLALHPHHGTATLGKVQIQLEQGDLKKARETARDLLLNLREAPAGKQSAGTIIATHRKLFSIARMQSDEVAMRAVLDELITADPRHVNTFMSRVEYAKDLGSKVDAEKALQDMIDTHPESIQAHVQLGLHHRHHGDHRKALSCLQRAVDLSVDSDIIPRAYVLLIQEYLILGDADRARELWQRIPDDQHSLDSHLIGHKIPDLTESKDFTDLYDMYGPHPALLRAWSQDLEQKRQYDEALKVYELADIDSLGVGLHRARLEHLAERPETAYQIYQKLLSDHPKQKGIHLQFSQFLLQQALLDEAKDLVEKGLSLRPEDPDLLQRSAAIRYRQCDIKKYSALVKSTAEMHPHHFPSQISLCQLLLRGGKYGEARQVLTQLHPSSAARLHKLHQMRAQTYMREYDYVNAHREFSIALGHVDHFAHDHIQLAIVQMSQGKIPQARQTLLQATAHLSQSAAAGRTIIPTRSHIHRIINDLRARPAYIDLLGKEGDLDMQWKNLHDLVRRDPWYLGSGIYTCLHLRQRSYWQQCMMEDHSDLKLIPRRIIQYWDSTALPRGIQQVAQRLQDFHPEYTYIRYSKKMARSFLRAHLSERVTQAFELCKHAAMESDYFRLACLYVYGGFYVDVDDMSVASLEPLRARGFQFVAHQEDLGSVGNNLIGCVPQHAIIKRALDQATETLHSYANEGPWFQTGPALLSAAVAAHIVTRSPSRSPVITPLAILSGSDYRSYIFPHLPMPYKNTDASWFHRDYHVTLSATSLSSVKEDS